MAAQAKQNAIRRSTRLPLEIPVSVNSLDAALDYSEEGTTTLVNAHGCGLIARRSLPRGMRVRIEIIRSQRQTTARAADVVSLGGDPETWLLGLEFETPGNFWGIEYPPSDWKIEVNADPGPVVSPALPDSAPAARPQASAHRWRLTDISAGACYLEGADPFPVGAAVLLSVRVANAECLLDGVVRASHPGSGMGLEFTSRSGDHRKRVGELVSRLGESREVPRVFIGRKEGEHAALATFPSFSAADDFAEVHDPLLELIRRGDLLPVEAFLDALKAQRMDPSKVSGQ